MTSPQPLASTPDLAHPSWCDPRRCVRGQRSQIHIGTPERWYSTITDLEYSLSIYQDDGEPEAYLLTLRATATSGTFDHVLSDDDFKALIAARDRLRNDGPAGSESTSTQADAPITG